MLSTCVSANPSDNDEGPARAGPPVDFSVRSTRSGIAGDAPVRRRAGQYGLLAEPVVQDRARTVGRREHDHRDDIARLHTIGRLLQIGQ
jgi:hypothetical protein